MTAFVLTMFWVNVLSVVVYMARLVGEHPRHQEPVSVGYDCASLIVAISFMAWAAYLLWGAK